MSTRGLAIWICRGEKAIFLHGIKAGPSINVVFKSHNPDLYLGLSMNSVAAVR